MFSFQLDRFSGLGYFPVLIIGKEFEGKVVAEIKYSLDFQLPPPLEKSLMDTFETILRSKYCSVFINKMPAICTLNVFIIADKNTDHNKHNTFLRIVQYIEGYS